MFNIHVRAFTVRALRAVQSFNNTYTHSVNLSVLGHHNGVVLPASRVIIAVPRHNIMFVIPNNQYHFLQALSFTGSFSSSALRRASNHILLDLGMGGIGRAAISSAPSLIIASIIQDMDIIQCLLIICIKYMAIHNTGMIM